MSARRIISCDAFSVKPWLGVSLEYWLVFLPEMHKNYKRHKQVRSSWHNNSRGFMIGIRVLYRVIIISIWNIAVYF